MKNLLSLLSLLIFILNISHDLLGAEANDGVSPDAVLDVDGSEVKTGTNYYVISNFRPGGGVSLYHSGNKTGAVAELLYGQGLPVIFDNGGSDLGEAIRESTNLIISFATGALFPPANWKVDGYGDEDENHFVVVGERHEDEDFVNYQFQIRKRTSYSGYSFYFCPKKDCTNVGIYIDDDGIRRVALIKSFLFSEFSFKKAC